MSQVMHLLRTTSLIFLMCSCSTPPATSQSSGSASASSASESIKVNPNFIPPETQIIGFSTPSTPDIPVNSNDVTDAIEARKHEMADCHARSIDKKRRKLAQGQILFEFRFPPAGGNAIVAIHRSTVKNHRLEECSLDFMKSLRFRNYQSADGKAVRIVYPFRFVARN